jgi:hypothetical protein
MLLGCRARYEESMRRRWKRGDRFKMFWESPDEPGQGLWWHGVVRGQVQRDRFDTMRASPWEALRVRWDWCAAAAWTLTALLPVPEGFSAPARSAAVIVLMAVSCR